jgi:hypothetical protein
MLGGFSFVIPIWLVIPILVLLVLGGVKLVKVMLVGAEGMTR